MTESEQVVTNLRQQFEQFVQNVYQAKEKAAITRPKAIKWFNHGIADLETGLKTIEKALLSTPSRSRREQEQQTMQSNSSYRGG